MSSMVSFGLFPHFDVTIAHSTDHVVDATSRAWKSKEFRPQISWADVEREEDGRSRSITDIRNEQERKRSVDRHEKV